MNVALRNQLMDQYNGPIQISANGLLMQKNIFDRLKFAFAVAPLRTKRAFKQVGIKIENPSELATIAALSENGYDKRGVKMPDGKVYAFSVQDMVKKILSERETAPQALLANAPIEWTY